MCDTPLKRTNYFYFLGKTENWEKTGIVILETEPNLIVDCSDFLHSFLFEDLHSNLEEEIMNKYELNEEPFNQNGGSLKNFFF